MGRPAGSKNKSNSEKLRNLQNEINIELFGDAASETDEDIDKRIGRTFRVLNKVIRGVIEQNIRSVIISGAPGCGKTFTVEHLLAAAHAEGDIKYIEIKGSMSAVKLYQTLYEHNDERSILVIDDCDAVYFDTEALDVLKSALDSNDNRVISWNKQNNIFLRDGIPESFEYNGSCIFITNIDLNEEIERGTKIAPHIAALISRSIYVDLGIYNKREILVRISQVLNNTTFLEKNGLTAEQGEKMITWLRANVKRLRLISIRTLLQLGSILKTDPDWIEMAEVTLCRRR